MKKILTLIFLTLISSAYAQNTSETTLTGTSLPILKVKGYGPTSSPFFLQKTSILGYTGNVSTVNETAGIIGASDISSTANYGLIGSATGVSSPKNIGIYGTSNGAISTENVGVFGQAYIQNSTGQGVRGFANSNSASTDYMYGGQFISFPYTGINAGVSAYGVHGSTESGATITQSFGLFGISNSNISSLSTGVSGWSSASGSGNEHGGSFYVNGTSTGDKFGLFVNTGGSTSVQKRFGTYSVSAGPASTNSYGIYAETDNTNVGVSYGGYFIGGGNGNGSKYGIYATASGSGSKYAAVLDGKVGISTTTPAYPLAFNDVFGDKISFYSGSATNTTPHYGIGIQTSQFQFFTPFSTNDFVFGIGRSGAFIEKVRIKGTGFMGIGVASPDQILDVNGRARIRHVGNSAGIWMSNSTNGLTTSDGSFFGNKTDTEAGIWIGNNWQFWITNTGTARLTGGVDADGVSYFRNGAQICSGGLDVGGNIRATGAVLSNQGLFPCPSDIRFKKDIQTLPNALSKVLQMRGVSYFWKQEDFKERNFTNSKQMGFIAQELEQIIPDVVLTLDDGYKAVDYSKITALLTEAIKDQQKIIDDLRNKNQKLESRLDKIEASINGGQERKTAER